MNDTYPGYATVRRAAEVVAPVDAKALTVELDRAGCPVRSLRLLSQGRSLVFSDDERVVRLGPEDHVETLNMLSVATDLAARRAPILAPLTVEPVTTRLGTVTFWPLARPSRDPSADLGSACRGLHTLTVPFPSTTNPGLARRRLRRQLRELSDVGVPESVHGSLLELASDLPDEPAWCDRTDPGNVLVHGDAHPGNVLVYAGSPKLVDIGGLTVGPRELDLVPMWVNARRGNGGWELWRRFRDAYRAAARPDESTLSDDLTLWPHLAEAVLERELTTTAFLAAHWHHHQWVRAEVTARLRSWHDPSGPVRWDVGL